MISELFFSETSNGTKFLGSCRWWSFRRRWLWPASPSVDWSRRFLLILVVLVRLDDFSPTRVCFSCCFWTLCLLFFFGSGVSWWLCCSVVYWVLGESSLRCSLCQECPRSGVEGGFAGDTCVGMKFFKSFIQFSMFMVCFMYFSFYGVGPSFFPFPHPLPYHQARTGASAYGLGTRRYRCKEI